MKEDSKHGLLVQRKGTEDKPTPGERLDLIEAKGPKLLKTLAVLQYTEQQEA